ncbi:MAG TPA: acyl-CoA dehydrogenase family protein [Chloroflexota bacterium]|nr:acyl-CoA dehydrogenase family protein [Chloroflexota bacterium]
MKLGNYFTSNRDLTLYIDELIPWHRLVPLVEGPAADVPTTVATWRDVLVMAGEYCGKEIAARAREVDEASVTYGPPEVLTSEPMLENLRGLRELGLIGLGLPREYGGAGLPFTVAAAMIELLARACPSTMVQYAFYVSPAAMIVRFGTEEQKKLWVPRLARGEIIGAVAMTEPEAGSDVGNLSTTASPGEDGSWRLSGGKQFISSGNGQMVIVLARCVPGSRGLDGLGLFIVPRRVTVESAERDNYRVERAERKLCIAGSPTCALSFADSQAELLGEVGGGFAAITSFMNESRVAVGIQALGLAQAAYEAASDYAAQRVQMGVPIREHPLVAEMLLDMEASVVGLRALCYEAAVTSDLVMGLEREGGSPERARRMSRYLRELTPLVKYHGAEEAVRLARVAVQVHGGYGVIKDYDVERFARDSLILPIYEGTSQIQALMATKDLMKAVLANPRTVLASGPSPALAQARFDGALGRDFGAARSKMVSTLRYLLVDLARGLGPRRAIAMATGRSRPEFDDFGYVLLHAERLTQMLARLHITRLLANQAARIPERRPIAERFARHALRLCQTNAAQIRSGDRSTLEAIARWRAGESA